MRELVGMQTYIYMGERQGAGQMFTLCASIVVPRVIDDGKLQAAANELFRINDGLRSRFVEAADGKVYEETLPYEEQEFEVLHFKSREKLDAWGRIYGTIPNRLDIRFEGTQAPQAGSPTPVPPAAIAHGIAHAIATKVKAKKIGVGDEVGSCIIKLVQLPGASGAVVKVHHIIADGWAMMVLANQFLQLLKGETPRAYQFEEHLENEARYKQSKTYQRDLAYFDNQLREHPETPRMTRKSSTNMVAARTTAVLDESLSASIRRYAEEHKTSPNTLFLVAAGALVRHELSVDSFYLGSVCANRAGIKERNTVGLFINTPSFHVEMDGSATFADAVDKMRDENYSAFRHQRACNDASVQFPQAMTVSYQVAALQADDTAICTQYYCDYMPAFEDGSADMVTIEDRFNEGHFKIHRDHNVQRLPKKKALAGNDFMLKVIRDGIADDSKTIGELSA